MYACIRIYFGGVRERGQTHLPYFPWGFGRDRTRRQTSHCYCYWGLRVQGFDKSSMYKKIPPVGTPTIPGLAIFKRGPHSPSLLNQNVRSALCRAPLSSQPTSFIRSGYEWAVYGTDQLLPTSRKAAIQSVATGLIENISLRVKINES